MTDGRLSNEELVAARSLWKAVQDETRGVGIDGAGDLRSPISHENFERFAYRNWSRLLDHIATLQRSADESALAFDANVERLKACEHIAEGDEDWRALRNLCPSTAAVADLRDALDAAQRSADEARESLARWMLENSFATGHGDTIFDLLSELKFQLEEQKARAHEMREALEHTRTSLGHAVDIIEHHVDRDALGMNSDGDGDVPGGLRSWPLLDEYLHHMAESMAKSEAALKALPPQERAANELAKQNGE